jgi:hypothetical protein
MGGGGVKEISLTVRPFKENRRSLRVEEDPRSAGIKEATCPWNLLRSFRI